MKKLILPFIVLGIAAGVLTVFALQNAREKKAEPTLEATKSSLTPEQPGPSTAELQPANGRYEEYTADKVAATGYENSVLFFYAGWCPECRSFKQAITSSSIPPKTQVLEVNYDKATDLKKQYNVTLQSTFVKVDSSGNQVSKWVGYGKKKDLQTVLSNL